VGKDCHSGNRYRSGSQLGVKFGRYKIHLPVKKGSVSVIELKTHAVSFKYLNIEGWNAMRYERRPKTSNQSDQFNNADAISKD
jgi:hypothetical protein